MTLCDLSVDALGIIFDKLPYHVALRLGIMSKRLWHAFNRTLCARYRHHFPTVMSDRMFVYCMAEVKGYLGNPPLIEHNKIWFTKTALMRMFLRVNNIPVVRHAVYGLFGLSELSNDALWVDAFDEGRLLNTLRARAAENRERALVEARTKALRNNPIDARIRQHLPADSSSKRNPLRIAAALLHLHVRDALARIVYGVPVMLGAEVRSRDPGAADIIDAHADRFMEALLSSAPVPYDSASCVAEIDLYYSFHDEVARHIDAPLIRERRAYQLVLAAHANCRDSRIRDWATLCAMSHDNALAQPQYYQAFESYMTHRLYALPLGDAITRHITIEGVRRNYDNASLIGLLVYDWYGIEAITAEITLAFAALFVAEPHITQYNTREMLFAVDWEAVARAPGIAAVVPHGAVQCFLFARHLVSRMRQIDVTYKDRPKKRCRLDDFF